MRRVLIDLTVLTILLVIFFRLMAQYELNFGWVAAFATLTIPASIAGELHGLRTGKEVSSGFAWQVAFWSGVVLAVLNALFSAIRFQAWLFVDIMVLLVGIFGTFLLAFLSIRLVFRWGVKFGARKNPQSIDPGVFD